MIKNRKAGWPLLYSKGIMFSAVGIHSLKLLALGITSANYWISNLMITASSLNASAKPRDNEELK
jgi:hypothetical protein